MCAEVSDNLNFRYTSYHYYFCDHYTIYQNIFPYIII